MRILGFSKKWPKLDKPWFARDIHTFTTFRYPRRDRDWEVEEVVQVVYKPRSKEREPLGIARIIRIQPKDMSKRWSYYAPFAGTNTPDMISPAEAEEDGFTGKHGGGDVRAMKGYIFQPGRDCDYIINKLILYWIERLCGKA